MYHMLPGSFENDDGIITVGVHNGPNEFSMQGLRYLRVNINEIEDKSQSIIELLGKVYENSEGCVLQNNFQMTAEVK